MDTGARAALLTPTKRPERGAIGLVEVYGRTGPIEIGAICTGTRWAAMSHRGLRLLKAQPVAAWRLPNVG